MFCVFIRTVGFIITRKPAGKEVLVNWVPILDTLTTIAVIMNPAIKTYSSAVKARRSAMMQYAQLRQIKAN